MTINRFTKDQTITLIAQFLPDGKALASKYCEGTNLRSYLSPKSVEFKRFQDIMATFLEELDPRTTELFIEEWESALGIPDACIPLAATAQERRDNIVLKLTSLSVQTEEDFRNLGEQFGFTIEFLSDGVPPYDVPFTPLSDVVFGVPPYDVPFIPSGEDTSFVWLIFADFSSDPTKAAIFQCLVKALIPAYTRVIFLEIP